MNRYRRLSYILYVWSQITGRAIYFEDCVLKPGWRFDHIWEKESNGKRNYYRVRSRVLRTVDRIIGVVVTTARQVRHLCRLLIHFLFKSRSHFARILRWLIGAGSTIALERALFAVY